MQVGKTTRFLHVTLFALLHAFCGLAETTSPSPFNGLSAGGAKSAPALDPCAAVGQVRSRYGFCTGTLLSPYVVLTAAHCVSAVPVREIDFTLDRNPFWNGETRLAKTMEVKIHPGYGRASFSELGPSEIKVNDLALVFLESTSYGEPPPGYLPLNSVQSFWKGRPLQSPGYGTNANGSHSQFRVATVDVLMVFAPGNFILMSPRTGEQVVCKGDSGGPLVGENNGGFEIVGVLSAGGFNGPRPKKDNCETSTLAYYTGTLAHKEWISRHTAWLPPARGAASVPGLKDKKSSW